MPLNKELLAILACPKCRGTLKLLENEEGLACKACAVIYPVRDEIPVLLIEEAIALAQWEQGTRSVSKK